MSESALTPKLLEVAQLLAAGLTYKQVAEATNTPRSTVGRWAKLAAVQAEVESLRAEALEAHRQISKEAATQCAEDLQVRLGQSLKRQEQMISLAYSLGIECFELTRKMLGKASKIFENDKPIEPHEKLLITALPNLMRAASDTLRASSDVEDKCFALDEISKRLDEWQTQWSERN